MSTNTECGQFANSRGRHAAENPKTYIEPYGPFVIVSGLYFGTARTGTLTPYCGGL
jgi:hypothetical protein